MHKRLLPHYSKGSCTLFGPWQEVSQVITYQIMNHTLTCLFPLSSADGEPIKLPDNLESLPRADHFPTQRHRWNTNEVCGVIFVGHFWLSPTHTLWHVVLVVWLLEYALRVMLQWHLRIRANWTEDWLQPGGVSLLILCYQLHILEWLFHGLVILSQ